MARVEDFTFTPYKSRSMAERKLKELNIKNAQIFKTKSGLFSIRKKK